MSFYLYISSYALTLTDETGVCTANLDVFDLKNEFYTMRINIENYLYLVINSKLNATANKVPASSSADAKHR
jgi:hypothetical protein